MIKGQRRIWLGGATLVAVGGVLLLNGGPAAVQAQITGQPVLTNSDQLAMLSRAQRFALSLSSAYRSVAGARRPARVAIAIVSRDGRLLNSSVMTDAWVGAQDLAIARARAAAFFSSNENAMTSRFLYQLSQAHDPKTGDGPAGPLWGVWSSNEPSAQFGAVVRNGVATQPGGVPLYKSGVLVGAIGVAGDGPDQDEAVAFQGETGFVPPNGVALEGFPQ